MTDPGEHEHDAEELDLDAEIVSDLEPSGDEAEDVRGGATLQCCTAAHGVSCILPK